MDSAIGVNSIKTITNTSFYLLTNIIDQRKQFMVWIADCELVPVYWEKNIVANGLANWSYNRNLGYHHFENPSE